MWDSRLKEEYWKRKNWLPRYLKVGERNFISAALAPRDKVIFPPLHIELGFIKQFVKALNKEGKCYENICKSLPGISTEKLKAGLFVGPYMRKIIRDD